MVNYFDEAPCIFFSLADDGTILEVNKLLCNSLGYERAELTGQKSDVLFTIPTRIFQQTHFFPLLKMQGHAEEIFISLRKKNGDYLPVLINAERKSFADDIASLYVGIVVHNRQKFEEELIAARHAAEKALNENTALVQAREELQKQAEELDQKINIVNKQNEELRQFNQVVTHNIQEPLRKLSIFSGLLVEEKDIQRQQALVEKVKGAMTQMNMVISGLQQYVWLNESLLNPETLDFEQILHPIKNRLATEHPGVELVLQTDSLPSFEGDRAQIELLFYQLLYNAIRFRKEAGKAFVRITASELRHNRFRHVEGKYKYDYYLRIQVQDSGLGFDDNYKDQAFELFKRLHKQSGRGVGLALCKKVTDNHQGNISISSKMGEGTVVTVLLPLHPGSTNIV
mgnify:FL=1